MEKELPFEEGSQDTVIARHILEHCVDVVDVFHKWKKLIKEDGRLIVAVPDESQAPSISLNPEHVHAFTPESLSNIGRLCGLKTLDFQRTNSMSFVMIFQKNGHHEN